MSQTAMNTLSRAVKLSYSWFKPLTLTRTSTRPPLLIIHGLFGSKKNWQSIAKALSRSGQQIITVDARNHGDSPHTDAMDYHTMSLDVVQLLADLRLERVDLLGHSMGGKIAMALALTKPDLIEKLIIEDISPTISLSAASFPFYVLAMKKVTFDASLQSLVEARRSADEQLHNIFPDSVIRNFILTNVAEIDDHFGWRVNLSSISNNMYELLDFPHFDTCFYGNTLFIGGSNSAHISEPFYSDIHRLFPRAVIQHIEGAGHWVHSEKPFQFMTAVRNFLQ